MEPVYLPTRSALKILDKSDNDNSVEGSVKIFLQISSNKKSKSFKLIFLWVNMENKKPLFKVLELLQLVGGEVFQKKNTSGQQRIWLLETVWLQMTSCSWTSNSFSSWMPENLEKHNLSVLEGSKETIPVMLKRGVHCLGPMIVGTVKPKFTQEFQSTLIGLNKRLELIQIHKLKK